jgi:hypothetical protein
MNGKTKPADWTELEPELAETLRNFKSGMDAWSQASVEAPRPVAHSGRTLRSVVWRLAMGTALGCLLIVTLTLALMRPGRHEQAGQTASGRGRTERSAVVSAQQSSSAPAAPVAVTPGGNRLVEAARELADVQELLAREDMLDALMGEDISNNDELLAAVGNDVARQVPRAMEAMAQLASAGGYEE